jgi:uncharacterized protein (UPF0335 family)
MKVIAHGVVGHNSAAYEAETGIAGEQLKAFVERIERIEEELSGLQGDRKDVYLEAKSSGFDAKVIRRLIAERKRDAAEREEEEVLLALYRTALGMD